MPLTSGRRLSADRSPMENWPGDKRRPDAPFGAGYHRLKSIGQRHDSGSTLRGK